MPPRTTQASSFEAREDNVLVIVGRLLEAAEAASSGISSLSAEAHATSITVEASKQAITAIQHTVRELDKLVRTGDNSESLVTRVHMLCEGQERHGAELHRLNETLAKVSADVDNGRHLHTSLLTGKNTVVAVAAILAWAITTAIALYAAVHGK